MSYSTTRLTAGFHAKSCYVRADAPQLNAQQNRPIWCRYHIGRLMLISFVLVVVRGLHRLLDMVWMRFLQTSRGDLHELGLL
ncbi:hypothetical protein CMUST_02845 [Corynebacterium mustelae]|uniref:Uncharacterized protein n=1 Tax=Corynebacterium mustelae TaxID=571915 RepID=A0A0G3GZC9_9CORY|nr:hypothetical protein CMUST_02845 [Corynebacterium mustelae]